MSKMIYYSEVAQSCLTFCNPMDCSPRGSSVHGILQARILEWVAISFSRGSSRPRDRTQVFHIAGRRFNLWATRELWLAPNNSELLFSKRQYWNIIWWLIFYWNFGLAHLLEAGKPAHFPRWFLSVCGLHKRFLCNWQSNRDSLTIS